MARLESVALAGFYPTPPHLIPRIAKLLRADPESEQVWVDPCAGEGAAIAALAEEVLPGSRRVAVFAAELEPGRAAKAEEALKVLSWRSKVAQGDAFRVRFEGTVSLAYLNPPYDHDRECGRLEERFLRRFETLLAPEGILVLVVPHYALAASAATLATRFRDLTCWRFPEVDFAAYKQVVLVATHREALLASDPAVEAQVRLWAADATTIPELPEDPSPVVTLPDDCAVTEWRVLPVDVAAILGRVRPWEQTDRGGRLAPVSGVLPDLPLAEVLTRRYPVAMPPRPAHIAAGIAAGIFNGARVSTEPGTGLPDLLVKGVFDKEFRTVEEKRGKEGEVRGVVQVQSPKLAITVLDLSTGKYHLIRPDTDPCEATKVEDLNIAGLLAYYGEGLMRVMLAQCPVLHDPSRPEDAIPLPALPRKLFRAQADAVMAAVKLLGGLGAKPAERRGKSVFVLGEIGCGKSTVALATAHTVGSRRTLVMCPPHLLASWQEQVEAVCPWVTTRVLRTVSDVAALAEDPTEQVVAILSRETAKLGHAWESVTGRCPTCGADLPDEDHARKRSRCESRIRRPGNAAAQLAQTVASRLAGWSGAPEVRQLLFGRAIRRAKVRAESPLPEGVLGDLWAGAAALLSEDSSVADVLAHLCAYDPRLVPQTARHLWAATDSWSVKSAARTLLLLAPKDEALEAELRSTEEYGYGDPWSRLAEERKKLADGERTYGDVESEEGRLVFRKHPVGAPWHIIRALGLLAALGRWPHGEACGEPLFQAVPQPRRVALATHIARRYQNLFDLFVLDECHEAANGESAQGLAAHRLMALGLPTLLMTGTVMNGYAKSLFANMWAASPDFRSEFGRDELSRFVDRYGYRKQLVEDKHEGKVVEYGSVTDRVERSARVIGDAPGVLPVFVLRHLLRQAVTIHKADLALDLPACREIPEPVTPSDELAKNYRSLEARLVAQIRKDRFVEGLAGKLWGAMAELPSYLDRATADVGNTADGTYEIRYPEAAGGALVAAAAPIPADTLLPKEEWLLAKLASEFAEGRRVMVFVWHTCLIDRLRRLITESFGVCPVLDPGKVGTAKRQAWIDKEVVAKARVMIVNPVAVQTGLNNLVWFASEIWYQNPACNPVVYRQAVGRVDRIGQKAETRIFLPHYVDTTQQSAHELLMYKVAVSMSTDGLDAESALQAAGAGDASDLTGFSVGRQLYELICARV